MVQFSISEQEHDRISEAVRKAEQHSDAEIVTIIAPRSDAYHDVALHYAVAAMVVFMGLIAAFPLFFSDILVDRFGGWDHALPISVQLAIVLGVQIALFLLIRYALAGTAARMALTPTATKRRRVRRQAVTLFRASAEGRTRGKTAILLYLSLAEHRAEIVADDVISAVVAPEKWGDAMAALIDHVKRGDSATGMTEAIGQIGAILAEYVPAQGDNPNELPDRLIEL